MRDASIPWFTLFALGAAHGINPAMGWLFAVGRGLQERNRRALWRAFGPLAIGHALAIAATLTLALTLGRILPIGWLRWIVCAALLAAGLDGLLHHRHVRLGGMRVGARELTAWSFLMASAHGAGLMVLPFVLGTATVPTLAPHPHDHGTPLVDQAAFSLSPGFDGLSTIGVAAPVIHTLGYLVVTCLLAVIVYEKVGLGILRRAWINVNVVWAAAMIAAGVLAAVQ
ncbi:MAG: hypothetical protein ABI601_06675 [bacterium]